MSKVQNTDLLALCENTILMEITNIANFKNQELNTFLRSIIMGLKSVSSDYTRELNVIKLKVKKKLEVTYGFGNKLVDDIYEMWAKKIVQIDLETLE